MTRANLEQALTDDTLTEAWMAYPRVASREHFSGVTEDAADVLGLAAMRESLVSALLSVEPPPPQTWQPIETAPMVKLSNTAMFTPRSENNEPIKLFR